MASKKVDNTRDLAPMTDPIAYRESYDMNNIKQPNDLIVYQDGKNTGSTVTQNAQSNETSTESINNPSNNGNVSKNSANRTLPAWVDPIAYRQDYDVRNVEWYDPEADLNPEYLANMDMDTPIRWGNQSFSQYWDDSSPEMQWTLWGMNKKYTWEQTKNSDVAYNAEITTKDLNPYYVYGQKSKVYGTLHPWYISQRNDNIASALYNEWRWSKEEVADYLSQQEWWFESSEADRLNTIEAVWKRIGQIAQNNPKKEDVPDMQLDNNTSGKLYGKNTANEWNPLEWIDTLADANSVYKAMNEGRVSVVREMNDLWVDNLAAMVYVWSNVYGDQAWRDFRETYPEIAAQVDQKVKQLKWQDAVNAIANGETLPSNNNTIGSVNNNIADFSNKNANWTTSSAEITKNINTMLDNNSTAQSAQELMWTLEWEMATLKNRLQNLRKEANSVFKWDVPDYIVNAYMNNKSQEIQNQLSILEDRYNAAYKRYTTEVSQAQWQQEFDLKKDELALKQKSFDLEKWATEEWIKIDWYKAKWTTNTTSTSNSWRELPVTTKTREEIVWIVDNLVDMAYNKQLGNAQCAAWIQRYYFPKLWITIWWLSTFEAKKGLINTDEYYVPQKWDLIIIDSWAKLDDWTPAWHIWIVVQVDWDNVRYLDWNGDWKEGVAVRTTSINSQKIAWYYDVTKWQTSWISVWTFSDADLWMFEGYLNWDLKDYQIKDLMNRYWVDENWLWNLANQALSQADEETVSNTIKTNGNEGIYSESDLSSIEVPDDVYIVDDWYQSRRVDPNSEEWKRLAQEYRIKKAKEMWMGTSSWTWNITSNTNLWFDTWISETYQWLIDWTLDIDTVAKNTGKSKRQIRKEMEAYQNAVNNWYDVYGYEWRNIDPELWFDPNRAEIYRWLIQNNFAVPWTQDSQKLLQLWLNPKDKNAWNIAIDEAHAYHERAKYNIMDDQLLELTRALEFIIAQGADQFQRWIGWTEINWWNPLSVWEMDDWNSYWNYIRNNWTLDHFEDIKKNWLTFWNLTEWELKIISTAANMLVNNWRNATAQTFKNELFHAYNTLRKELWHKELTEQEFNAMYNIEDKNKDADWQNFLALDHTSTNTRPFWMRNWVYGDSIDYRRHGDTKYRRWTEWYIKYWPWNNWLTSTREDLFPNK